MEPLDLAFNKFKALVAQVTQADYWGSITTEADTRMKLIDRVFVEVLGWPRADIHLESTAGAGFIDYRATISGFNRLIIEAKKERRDLGINSDHAARFFKLNGAVFHPEAAQEGIKQAITYCAHKGAELACVTNGRQWAVFRGSKEPDGKDILECQACVFGSLESVLTRFQQFYELLSHAAVSSYSYRAVFRQAEGQPLRRTTATSLARYPDSREMLPLDKLSKDLDRIMQSFFRDLSGDDDAKARRDCFVTTSESKTAEEALSRISEELRDKVRSLNTAQSEELTEAIKRVQEMKKNELVLLVGTKGAGKSTFIDRFFEDVLPPAVRSDCVIVRIDLSKSGNPPSVTKWLDEHFLEAAERAAYAGAPPTYDEIQGMFFGEYQRWVIGHARHLYESNKTQFKIDFGKHVEAYRRDRPHDYIKLLLKRIVLGHSKVPCLVFDNADHFNVAFQEEVFHYAHSLYAETLCLVILPITDTTSWQLSKQGPIQSFYTDSFFLPTPPTELVLRRRIEYIENRLAEEQTQAATKPESGRGYFLSRGMRLEIEDIRGFAACLQTVFLNTGQVAEWIGRLANHDIRRSLQFTREIVASPYIRVDELLSARVGRSAIGVNHDDVKLAIIRGRYDIYFQTVQSFIQNVYDLVPGVETTPLLPTRILRLLASAWEDNRDNDRRYVVVDEIVEYCQAMNIEARVARACLDNMLKKGLCLSYDPTAEGIDDAGKVEISPSGQQHLVWSQQDWVYFESMSEVTPMYDSEACKSIREHLRAGSPHLRRAAIATFLEYLLKEDGQLCVIPKHELYVEQDRIRMVLQQQLASLSTYSAVVNTTRYRRAFGRIATWKRDKGFGFVTFSDGTPDAFLHISEVCNAKEDGLAEGTIIECDIVAGRNRPSAVAAAILD